MQPDPNPSSHPGRPGITVLLAFDPVPVRLRRDGWTPGRQRRYVVALFETGHAGEAARLVGMTQQSAARLRRRPDASSFARACAEAYATGRWRLVQARRASALLGCAGRFDIPSPVVSANIGTL